MPPQLSSQKAFSLLELLFAIAIGSTLFTISIHFSLLAVKNKQTHWNHIEEQRMADYAGRLLAEDINGSPLRKRTLKNFPNSPPWSIQLWENEVQYNYRQDNISEAIIRIATDGENKILPEGWTAKAETKNGKLVIHWISPQGNTYSTRI
jgi:prepilin-type N-terminal cleavage/methylation domain-containing protein